MYDLYLKYIIILCNVCMRNILFKCIFIVYRKKCSNGQAYRKTKKKTKLLNINLLKI